MIYVAGTISIGIMLYYIFVEHKHAFYDLFFKTLSSLCFVMMACLLMPYGDDRMYMHVMMIGFILGAIGDAFLALPTCYPKYKDVFFMLGLGSFLLGHIAFVGALFQTGRNITILDAGISIVGGILLIKGLKKYGVDFEQAAIPSTLYAIVILFMELQAVSYLMNGLDSFSILLNIGSFAFVLSDFVLVFMLFGNKDTKGMTRLNLSLYYFAQMSLVFTFLVR